jgi:hypothetical protein
MVIVFVAKLNNPGATMDSFASSINLVFKVQSLGINDYVEILQTRYFLPA